MQWTNRYSHVLANDLVPLQYPLEIYMHWYRGAFGAHLQISDLVFQEDPEGPPVHNQEEHQQEPSALPPHPPSTPPPPPPPVQQEVQCGMEYVPQTHPSDYFTQSVPLHQEYWSGTQADAGEQASFSQLLGFMAPGPGYSHSGNVHDIPTDQLAHPTGITPRRMSFDSMPQVHTSSENSGARMSVDSSKSTGATRGILQSGLDRRISMTLIQETNNAVDNDTDKYLVDNPDSDEDEDDDEDEDEDHGGDPEPSTGTTTSEKGKGYNLRTDPPRRSVTRYTPSAFNRVAKKCKKLFKDVKSAMKK
ncbi:uncharacterized protein LOC110270922 [Arachis ipaensis]|uniref:uncharacterized protein LOC110270922 n=1 Tax=Arachis ipaensis TaxID=130454 RepID=UPI000A2B0A31|nr:uncharacterized protein LOC110270922 [Arachis ipaensis]